MPTLTPLSNIRGVLFDLDGTLADSEPLIARAVVESAAAYGYQLRPQQVSDALGPPMTTLLRSLLPIGEEEAQRIYNDYQERYNGRFVPQTQPLPGASELLASLHTREVPMAVVTNKNELGGMTLVEALGWTHFFQVVVGMNTAPKPKPAPDPALLALEVLRLPAQMVAFVGDSEADMGCGQAAGLTAIIGVGGLRPPAALKAAGATHTVVGLKEVAVLLAGACGDGRA